MDNLKINQWKKDTSSVSRVRKRLFIFFLFFFSIAVYSTSAAADLLAHWELDTGTGTTAVDSTGYGNNGTLINGPVWTAGQINGALRLDGQNDHVIVDSAPLAMETWSAITVAAWVKNDIGAGAGTDDILSWWRWNGYPCSDCSFIFTHHRNNKYFFEIKGAVVSGGSVGTGWTHVAATYDGSLVTLYVNGSPVDSAPYAGVIPFSSADFIIGSQGDNSNFFDGIIDDVHLFDHALTAQEVQDLFNGTTPGPDTTPPSILSVQASETSVVVEFDEALEVVSATDLNNYDISDGITIFDAALETNNKTVTLTTSSHVESIVYDLNVEAVEDLSGNAIDLTVVSYSAVLTNPGLMAHWKLDDGSGAMALDATGNGNHGTLVNGPVWTTGGFNGALIFDGQDDRVTVDSVPLAMDTWNAISVGGWIKHDIGAGAGTDDIISYWNYPSSRSWVLTHHGNNQYFWEIQGKGFVAGGTVSTDWTHVMGTYDGSTMRLYVNGVEVDSVVGLSGNLPNSIADIIIGGQADGSNYFDGAIDDVRIYGRTLSVPEIQDIIDEFNPEPINSPPTVSVSASPQVGVVPLQVQFSADAQDTDGTIVSYSWDFGDGGGSSEQNPIYTYNSAGDFTAQVEVTDDQGATASDSISIDVSSGPAGPGLIDVWYGPDQDFGNIGIAQAWANILGNVSDPDGIASLSYRLNGENSVDLSFGPDDRRLVMAGDYNIDIDWADLQPDANSVEITVTDLLGGETTETMSLEYDDSTIWPLPYSIDWGSVTNIQDAVQVVDGLWTLIPEGLPPEGLRIAEMGYDRVIAIGDVFWTDYEVTVPITVNGYDTGPLPPFSVSAGFGITMRWTGHTDSPVTCPQPKCGWLPAGAGAWYDIGRGGPLRLDGLTDPTISINVGDTYIWKMRVETIPGGGSLYSLKVWKDDQAEPSGWNIQKQRGLWDETNGSVVLILHHVDATFGNLTVVPVGTSIPDTTPPTVESVGTISDTEVLVSFSEPVDQVSATNTDNYSIDNVITITGALLSADSKTVTLTTTSHTEGLTYTIDISDVLDQATPPNVMDPVSLQYTFTPPQPAQPVAQYLFEEEDGSIASDSSGNGYDGTLENGPAWVNDPERGNVIQLDGLDDHVTVNSSQLGMDAWGEITVAAWVKNDIGAGAGTDDIVSWWRWTGYPCSDCSFVLTHHKNNQYFFQMGNTYLSGGSVSTSWTFVVVTYDGSMIRLYVNGSEVASAPHSGGIPFSSADLIVGGQGNGSNYFDGRIDEVEIYDVALTADQILSRYNE